MICMVVRWTLSILKAKNRRKMSVNFALTFLFFCERLNHLFANNVTKVGPKFTSRDKLLILRVGICCWHQIIENVLNFTMAIMSLCFFCLWSPEIHQSLKKCKIFGNFFCCKWPLIFWVRKTLKIHHEVELGPSMKICTWNWSLKSVLSACINAQSLSML